MASDRFSSLVIPLVMLIILYCFSILFFHFVEGWSFLDAAYFTSITITTVGYGDITPVTGLGKIGAILLVFAGVSLAFYFISRLGMLREKKVDPHIEKRLGILKTITMLQSKKIKKGELKQLRSKMKGVKIE